MLRVCVRGIPSKGEQGGEKLACSWPPVIECFHYRDIFTVRLGEQWIHPSLRPSVHCDPLPIATADLGHQPGAGRGGTMHMYAELKVSTSASVNDRTGIFH